jgi:cytochrome c551/c552
MRVMMTHRKLAGSRSHRLILSVVTGLALLLALSACGGGGESGEQTGRMDSGSRNGESPLNVGPMAVEAVTLNPGLADWGAQVFEKRACVTCHTFGEDKQGPDLSGVATRRTVTWMKRQITDPEYMVKNDPIARGMYAKFALQMANQQVPDQEVDALIQFLVRESLENK